jgi:hypothetical protein
MFGQNTAGIGAVADEMEDITAMPRLVARRKLLQ